MSETPPNTQRHSVRRRIKGVICTLLCRPTRPLSPPQATSDLPSGAELLPHTPSKSTPLTGLVNGDPVSEGSAQELPGELLAGGNSAKDLDYPESLEDLASQALEATDTALDLAPAPSIPAHEEPIVGFPPPHTPTSQFFPTLPAGTQEPENVASADDDEEDIEAPLSIVEEEKSSLSNGETQGQQLYLTKVVIARNVAYDENTLPLRLTALCLLGVGGSQEGKNIPLDETSAQSWTLNERIALPLEASAVRCVVKDEEGQEVGFVDLNHEDLHMSDDNVRPFVTHDSRLSLSMSWKVAHDVAPSLGGNLAQAKGTHTSAGEVLDNPGNDPAFSLDGPIQENLAIVDYNDEGFRLASRFESTGRFDDINGSIFAFQKAVEIAQAVSSVFLSGSLAYLGLSLQSRFDHTGELSDITGAIAAQQAAIRLTPESHADLPAMLNNLGSSFRNRFERTGDVSDITEAIAAQQTAVQLTRDSHADLSSRLNNLGASFLSRFQRIGNMADVTQAIVAQQTAVQLTPEGHTSLPVRLNNLGNSFLSRFKRTGDMSDINEAITSQQAAVQLTPEGHPHKPSRLHNLGSSFQSRFEHTGDMVDITEAIAAQQAAIQLTPKGHPDLLFMLNNLSTSFTCRYERTGDLSDITEAIATQQAAIQLAPARHVDLPSMLSNLGISFQNRFNHSGDMADIIEAIAAQQAAIRLTPEGDADLPFKLDSLGSSFGSRFKRTRDMPDITEAITAQKAAVRLTPDGHADRPARLNNLGTSLLNRFESTGDISDITEAIDTQQAAIQLTPDGHAALPSMRNNLGNSFLRRFEHAKSMDDMHSSLKCFRAATEDIAGAPTVRMHCAVYWARLISRCDPESLDALAPFGIAIRLLTLVAGLERTLQSRHSQLQNFSGVASEAAAAACRLGQPDKAVEWLEQGRCLVWGQLNGLRTPMEDLRQKDHCLAQRLSDVARKLEFAGSTRTAINPSMEISAKISLEEAARSHSALASKWKELLSAARKLPGFESFLLPTPCSSLLEGLPQSGPIIIINCYQDRCDALALLHGAAQPLHIPLSDLSLQKAQQYRRVLKGRLHANGIRVREAIGGSDMQLEGRNMMQGWCDLDEAAVYDASAVSVVLRSLWLEVVKPVLDMLGYSRYDPSSSSMPPRLWWCPTGVLSFLPIHAAGIYGSTDSDCVMDYVVSSYTPTVAAITNRVKLSPINLTMSGLFLTSQPNAPGALEIPGTTREVDEVYAKAMKKRMRVVSREGDDISVEECRRYMGEFGSVHLACHASQNASDPLQSRFLLHKGKLTLLSIIQMNIKDADLAFLSACQTSTGEEKLSDEAVHLAAGMLAAGYRRVVATMWSINDGQAPKVAVDFYEHLWRNRDDETGGGFDGSLSAHALHHAVQQLRRRLGNSERDLLTWIPYVHFGY